MKPLSWLVFIPFLTLASSLKAKEFVYMGLGEVRDTYHSQLLQEIIKHTDSGDVTFRRYEKGITHARAFKFLEQNEVIHIVVGYATKERDEKHLAIPIPILKGLNGWRLSVVHKDNVDLFKTHRKPGSF